MTVETVLLAVLGVVAVWLAFDAGRERHRLRVRMERSAASAARRRHERTARSAEAHGSAAPNVGGLGPADESWRYWPLTLPSTDETSIGRRF
jgi:hypothetical protein